MWLASLGRVAFYESEYPIARALWEESLEIVRELGDRVRVAIVLNNLGALASEQGDYAASEASYKEGLAIRRQLGDKEGIATLEGYAALVAARSNSLHAARTWGAAERLRDEIGSSLPPNARPIYDRRVTTARAALRDDAAFDRAWQEGRVLTLEQAIELALQETVEQP